jgi:hypothetical protein
VAVTRVALVPAVIVAALAAALAGCSSHGRAKGRLVVAVSVDWEGAELSPEGLDALDELRKSLGPGPLTHFVSAAYFTKDHPDPRIVATLTEAIHPGDELALHLHAWRSLARAAGVEPKLSPSFVTGTDKLFTFDDGDIGFDTDLDVYNVTELRAMVRTSRRLLEQTHLPVGKSFRAGGYLGTPRVLQAVREEGFVVDSSATDSHQLDAHKDAFLPKRVREVWPKIDTASQPFFVDPQRQLLELPIADTADYVTAADVVGVVEAADARLQADPAHDVFVVLGCNQETAQEFASHLGEALAKLRTRHPLADHLLITTVEKAAALARGARVSAPRP